MNKINVESENSELYQSKKTQAGWFESQIGGTVNC